MKNLEFLIKIILFPLVLTSCGLSNNSEKTLTVTFDTCGGSEIESQEVRYCGKIDEPLEPTRTGYTFVNWTYQEEVWSFVGYVATEDMTLLANWTPNEYTLTLVNDDETQGMISGGGVYYYDSTVTIRATQISLCVFSGWYEENGSLISSEANYTFKMGLDKTFVAKWSFPTDKENREKYGIEPKIDDQNNMITYGLYPQSHVSDDALSKAIARNGKRDKNGRYHYDGCLYEMIYNQNITDTTLDDGTIVRRNFSTAYWFKLEPIQWKILKVTNDEYLLLSTLILDAHRFDLTSNNYKESEIREYLNNTFYSKAFGYGDDYIVNTLVDNGPSTTEVPSNPYCCDDTTDKVFLLSYQDYYNEEYGFSSSKEENKQTRACKTSDFARVRGVDHSESYPNTFNGDYWTRSPCCEHADGAWDIYFDGDVGDLNNFWGYVNCDKYGVRPAITIKLPQSN